MDTTPIIAAMTVVLPAGGFIAGVFTTSQRWKKFFAKQVTEADAADEQLLATLDAQLEKQHRELTELRAWKASVLSGLKKAGDERKAKRKAIQDARHAGMRASLELI